MEFNVEAAGPCRKKVSVKIPQDRVSEEFNKSYGNWVKSVPIPGFRPGRAPRKLVEKRFGEQVALEVKQTLVDAAFEEALEQNDLHPITDPELKLDEISVDPTESMAFDFMVTVKPEFDLPDLGDIEVEVPTAEPTKPEVDMAIDDLRKRKATLRPIEGGKIERGDVVTLKVRGMSGESEVLHEDSLQYEVGSSWLGGLIAQGLDEQLEGNEVGVSVQAKAFAPPHHDQHPLAGQEIDLSAEVLDHKRPELPEVNDDFAKAFDFDSVDELVETVTRDVAAHKERERNKLIENLALMQLAEKTDFELPAELIEREVDDLARRAAYEMQMQEKSEEEIAQRIVEIRARRADESTRELKAFFILDKIVEQERLLVTENEVREAVAAIAAYNQNTPEQMYAMMRDSGRLGSLRNQLRERKAREKLRKKTTVKDAPPETADKKSSGGKKKAAKKTTKKKD